MRVCFLTGDGDLCTVFFFFAGTGEDADETGDLEDVFFEGFLTLASAGAGGGDAEKEIFAALFFAFPPLPFGGDGSGTESLGAECIAGVIREDGGEPESKAAINDI